MRSRKAFDLAIWIYQKHHRTFPTLVNIKKHYLFPGNKIVGYEIKGDNYPYLVKAYRSILGVMSVPIDMIEKEYKGDNTVLVMPSGEYIVEIVDKDRKVQVKNLTVH